MLPSGTMARSYYNASIQAFLQANPHEILGYLTQAHHHDLEHLQRNAWLAQIGILQEQLKEVEGHIFFEFSIPRMGKRADNILLVGSTVFVVEFKIGSGSYDSTAIEQTLDYALDLKNFHEGSHTLPIIPILVSTEANSEYQITHKYPDQISEVLRSNGKNLRTIIEANREDEPHTLLAENWATSIYKPTPTIIEAAKALYQGHQVTEISRSDAGAINLSRTAASLNAIIEQAKHSNRKSICFVTGVPGAGKTLAGLNIVQSRVNHKEEEHAVFLSGNGPLVIVLREALARDLKSRTPGLRKGDAAQRVASFIQNIHHFRDDALENSAAPVEKVVVFDEAQRAWNSDQASKFMKQKRGQDNFNKSEPEFLIETMDRHNDWCVVVCLVGGGQEINTGEAGISAWLEAIYTRFDHWSVHLSEQIISNTHYVDVSHPLRDSIGAKSTIDPDLHLAVSVRSFRSEIVSDFFNQILQGDSTQTRYLLSELDSYPVLLTRDIKRAKSWLLEQSRGTERCGILASSGALRLKAIGVNVKASIDPANWFLNPKEDVRSSNFLEDVATEFDIQGLELDWTAVIWDIDLSRAEDRWDYRRFVGTRWQNVKNETRQDFLLNAYRVLLTRARQGVIIVVPEGDDFDHTRPRERYDSIFNYLIACGIRQLI